MHINQKELLAVIYGVLAFADRLRPGEHITQWVDSSVTAANVFNWTSRSPVSLVLLRILRRLIEYLGFSMSTQRLPSALNLLSDRLSRTRPAYDWKLSRPATEFLERRVGPPRVQHFAVRLSAIVKRYTSRLADPYSEGLAFDAPWENGDFLTPPPHALPLVLARLRDAPHPGLVLVTPDWPTQPWFTIAAKLASPSWRLPFPVWNRASQPSPWSCRAFLMGEAPADAAQRHVETGSYSEISSPSLYTAYETGIDSFPSARALAALPCQMPRHRATAVSSIASRARTSLSAFFNNIHIPVPNEPHAPEDTRRRRELRNSSGRATC